MVQSPLSYGVFLLVDPPADVPVNANRPFLIQAPCCKAHNSVLLESDIHPSPEIVTSRPRLLTTPDTRFLPHVRCQSITREPQAKVYIPTIPLYLEELLAQIRWLQENGYAQLRTLRGCGIFSPLFVLGDAKPEEEAVTVIEERVGEPDGKYFGSI